MIFQLEGKKQIQNQSLNQIFHFPSDLESKNLQLYKIESLGNFLQCFKTR